MRKKRKVNCVKNSTTKRISAIDILVILLLIAAVIGVGFKVFAGNVGLFAGEKEEYHVSYVIEAADSQIGKYVTEGTTLYTEDGEVFGTIVGEVITTPAKIYNVNSDGEYVVGYSSGSKIDIEGTVSVRATNTEKGLVCANDYLCAGMKIKVYGGAVASEILITDVSKVSQ